MSIVYPFSHTKVNRVHDKLQEEVAQTLLSAREFIVADKSVCPTPCNLSYTQSIGALFCEIVRKCIIASINHANPEGVVRL